MIHEISSQNSIANSWTRELRDVEIQKDRMRFRNNLQRIGQTMAYEISKSFYYENQIIETPLGKKNIQLLSDDIVIGTIMRAGIPFYQGFLDVFDHAESAFIGSYRKENAEGSFDITQGYLTCPILTDKVLILVDPMLATGSSFVQAMNDIQEFGNFKKVLFVSIISSPDGTQALQRKYPEADIWVMDIDEAIDAKSYILPGLGDAGDLAFGPKSQH